MLKLSKGHIYKYLQRCYAAVDGLWFVKTEEKLGFKKTLEIDKAVWKVMPKIQARALKAMAPKKGLKECFETKLVLDGFKFKTSKLKGGGFDIKVSECPWHNILINAGRKKYADKIGSAICTAEFPVWITEFNEPLAYELKGRICAGAKNCVLRFKTLKNNCTPSPRPLPRTARGAKAHPRGEREKGRG